jgi:cyclopropane fatty-acyl-phospholipid synthase-like methyltransferase
MSQKVPSHLYDQRYYLETDGIGYYRREVVPPKIEKALRLAEIKEGMTVVDIGCGRGDFIFAALKEKVRLIGIDYALEAVKMSLALLEKLPKDKKKTIYLLLSDGTELPLQPQSVDVVFLMDLVEHLYPEQLKRCMAELREFSEMEES